jgi:hypothetical protein
VVDLSLLLCLSAEAGESFFEQHKLHTISQLQSSLVFINIPYFKGSEHHINTIVCDGINLRQKLSSIMILLLKLLIVFTPFKSYISLIQNRQISVLNCLAVDRCFSIKILTLKKNSEIPYITLDRHHQIYIIKVIS